MAILKAGLVLDRLTLIKKVSKFDHEKMKHETYWQASCKCGNVIEKKPSFFHSNKVREFSCGCANMRRPFTNLEKGKTIGKLTLKDKITEKDPASDKEIEYWIAECECGKVVKKKQSYFYNKKYSGKIPSCGCYHTQRKRLINPGDKIGEFKVIKKVADNKSLLKTRWLVECSCGESKTYSYLTLYSFMRFFKVSCGCKGYNIQNENDPVREKKERAAIKLNMTIGDLTVIESIADEGNSQKKKWLAECSCGNRKYYLDTTLYNYSFYLRVSCGCKGRNIRNRNSPSQRKRKNRIELDMVIGELKVIGKRNPEDDSEKTRWFVECSCGSRKYYSDPTLYAYSFYRRVSCGCKGRNIRGAEDNAPDQKEVSKCGKNINRKTSGTIDDFMTMLESADRWHVSADSVRDRIKQRTKNGKIDGLVKAGLIKPPYSKGSPWIISRQLMEDWYGPEPMQAKDPVPDAVEKLNLEPPSFSAKKMDGLEK